MININPGILLEHRDGNFLTYTSYQRYKTYHFSFVNVPEYRSPPDETVIT